MPTCSEDRVPSMFQTHDAGVVRVIAPTIAACAAVDKTCVDTATVDKSAVYKTRGGLSFIANDT